MSTRSTTTSFLMGLVLALSSLAVGFFGARTVQAQSCPPSVIFGCNLSGSLGGGTGWRVTNSSTSNASVAILGYASGNSGVTYGVNAQSNSPNGYGTYAVAAATSGTNYGVYGVTNSPSGYGIYGTATIVGGNGFGQGVVKS